jgi:hypothetical protein
MAEGEEGEKYLMENDNPGDFIYSANPPIFC